MAELILSTGVRHGEHLRLQKPRTVLGRGDSCDIVINESMLPPMNSQTNQVSRKHATISWSDGAYYIEDGDGQGKVSRNSTCVNGKKVEGKVLLRNHDRIAMCTFECIFHDDAETPVAIEATIDHESSIKSLQTQPAEKLRVILEISNSLSTTLELDTLLPRIVEQLFLLFKQADRGFILLRDPAAGSLTVRAFKTRKAGNAADNRYSVSIVQRCLANMEGILGNDLAQQFPDSESVCDLHMRSLMCVPLRSQDGQPLGAIQLDTQESRMKFTEEDLKLLLGVASQASIALCNSRLYHDSLLLQRREWDLDLAHQVLRGLLPERLPRVPDYHFYAYYKSAQQIGGDYYDFIPFAQQRLAILLGDVAGKGVAAALIMAKFSVEARVCLETEPNLAAAVSKLNDLMVRASVDRFVTLIAVVLDPATHAAMLVNAGHISPLRIRHATGQFEEAVPVAVGGPPIGVTPTYVYESCTVQLLPGDGLLLFSDGVTDAKDKQERPFGMKGIYAFLKRGKFSPRQTGAQLIDAVQQHARDCSQFDDITLVYFVREEMK